MITISSSQFIDSSKLSIKMNIMVPRLFKFLSKYCFKEVGWNLPTDLLVVVKNKFLQN